MTSAPLPEPAPRRVRMTGAERRLQIGGIARTLFALRGMEGTTIEEIASAAGVSKPVVYEHFGSKEALYMEVVTAAYRSLLGSILGALESDGGASPRVLVERAVLALLTYIEEQTEGFRILVRDVPPSQPDGTFSTLLAKVAEQVEDILAEEFRRRGFSTEDRSVYAQMLVGMVAMTGRWWLEARHPDKRTVAAHMVNLAWYGLTGLKRNPELRDDTE